MSNHPRTTSPVALARMTGILYLIIIICAGFSQGVVRSSLVIPGDAASTAANILASEGLYRLGFVTDLIAFLSDLAVSVLLYILLRPVNKTLSLIAASFRLLAHPAIASVNLLNHYLALHLLGGESYLGVFSPDQLYALVLLFLDTHTTGYLIGGAFFGVSLLLHSYLVAGSGYFPRVFGILLAIAGVGYMFESFGTFLLPAYAEIFTWIVAVTAVLGEVSFTGWLLIKGLKPESWNEQAT